MWTEAKRVSGFNRSLENAKEKKRNKKRKRSNGNASVGIGASVGGGTKPLKLKPSNSQEKPVTLKCISHGSIFVRMALGS